MFKEVQGFDVTWVENCSVYVSSASVSYLDYKEIKEDAKRSEHFSTVCQVLKEYVGEELPNSAELLGIYGRVIRMIYYIC